MAIGEMRLPAAAKIASLMLSAAGIAILLVVLVLLSVRLTASTPWHPFLVTLGLLGVVGGSLLARLMIRQTSQSPIQAFVSPNWLRIAVVVAVVLFGLLIAPPQQGWPTVTTVWICLATSELLQWRFLRSKRPLAADHAQTGGETVANQRATLVEHASINHEAGEEEETYLPEDVSLRLTRATSEEGESVHALMRASFLPGQRSSVLHVGFCPPLTGLSEVECFVVEGADARLKIAQQNAFGVRLELKLVGTAKEACDVVVEVIAMGGAGKAA